MGSMTATRPGLFALDVTAAIGTPFRVLAIPPGVEGPNRYRAPADREYALVEFYDRRYPVDAEHGHFTGAHYQLADLMEGGPYGLDLNGRQSAWQVDAPTMHLIRTWLAQLERRGELDKR